MSYGREHDGRPAEPHVLPTGSEAELRRALAFLEEAVDALPASVVLLDVDGTIVFVNGQWQVTAHELALGMPRNGIGANYLEVCDRSAARGDADAARVAEGIRDVLARRSLTFESEYLLEVVAGEEPQWYRLNVIALETGGALVHHLDISAERRAQRARTEASAYFQSLFEGSLDGTVLYDDDLRILLANRAAADLCQTTVSHLCGRSLLDLVPHEDLEALAEQHDALLQRGATRSAMRLLRANGSIAELDVASRANVVAGKHLASWRDVTARRQLEGQLRQAQKMEAVGQLAGGIAHDFNNLLTVILAHAELLLDEEEPRSPDLTAGLRDIQRAARRGADMVGKLLAFGRQGQLRLGPAQVEDLLRESCDMMRRLLPESISVTFVCHGNLPPVQVDTTAMQQVLLNLATNARDAIGPADGTLQLVARLADGAAHEGQGIDQEPVRGHVVISVADSGSGMSGETLARMFEPFFTTKPVGEGTGLGMAMVFGLMGQMHGRVSVESRLGEGTIVHLHVPVSASRVGGAAPEVAQRPGRAAAATILLVEDDAQIRQLALRILRGVGYVVEEACDGDDAYRRLAERRAHMGRGPALIISDIVMPGGGGARVLEAWQRYAPESRVLWMTGYAGEALVSGTGENIFASSAVIQKPWTGAELVAKVRELLGAATEAPAHVQLARTGPIIRS